MGNALTKTNMEAYKGKRDHTVDADNDPSML